MFHLGRNKSNMSGPARVRISARFLSEVLLKEPGAAPHGFLLHLQNTESPPTRDPRAGITAFVQNRGDQPCSKGELSAHIQLTRRLRTALLTRGSSQNPAARWHFKERWKQQGTEPQRALSLRASAGPQKGEGTARAGGASARGRRRPPGPQLGAPPARPPARLPGPHASPGAADSRPARCDSPRSAAAEAEPCGAARPAPGCGQGRAWAPLRPPAGKGPRC